MKKKKKKEKKKEKEKKKKKNHYIFSSQPRADQMPCPPWGGPADVYTLSKHASINRATPMMVDERSVAG